jgi:hypothetical protein
MLTTGLDIFAVAIVVLWACLPGPDGTMRRFLRGGLDVLVAIAIISGFGISFVLVIAGLAS